jgi:hypothetical protein
MYISFFLSVLRVFESERTLFCTDLRDVLHKIRLYIYIYIFEILPLWSSGQSSWLHTTRPRVRFSLISDLLSINESGMGSTQPRKDK